MPVRIVDRQEGLFTSSYTKGVAVPMSRNPVSGSCSVKTPKAFFCWAGPDFCAPVNVSSSPTGIMVKTDMC